MEAVAYKEMGREGRRGKKNCYLHPGIPHYSEISLDVAADVQSCISTEEENLFRFDCNNCYKVART